MGARGGLVLVLVAGCYAAPEDSPACSVTCTDTCPGDQTCVNGYCVGDGEVCDPAFQQVSAGAGFACAIDVRGLLWCWGSNAHHQIDATDTAQVTRATRIGDTVWQAISAGGGHACGISDGQLSCWGANDRGQVSGTVIGDVAAPLVIEAPGGPARWTSVTAGYNATCATGDDGSLFCWGAGDRGQLGNGAAVDSGVPTRVSAAADGFTQVALGWAPGQGHACAISSTSGLWCWGGNDNGELGNGTQTASLVPIQIALPALPTAVSALASSTCATTDDKRLWCWGRGDLGQLGDPALVTATQFTPVAASGLDGWTSVASAEQMSCAQRDDEMWCWGQTNGGNGIGNGIWGSTTSGSRGFARIATGIAAISVGENTILDDLGGDVGDLDLVCALQNGRVTCFGDNRFGQLGQGAVSMALAPAELAGARTWSGLAVGASHACALDGEDLYCWGSTLSGQVDGVVSGSSTNPCGANPDVPCDVWSPSKLALEHVTAMALGGAHSCALGDSLVCWGNDEVGQLGAPSLPSTPTSVAGAWTALLETHGNAVCAMAGSEVSCWGAMLGALLTPTRFAQLDGALAIGVSASIGSTAGFGCFLDQAGSLACVGANALAQYGNGEAGFCGDGTCNNNETSASCTIGECGSDPVVTPLGRAYTALSVGWGGNSSGGTACAITPNATVDCWGRNRNSVVTATIDPTTMRPPDYVFVPTAIAGLAKCTAVATGDNFACALCDGDISCWGDNRRGAVGVGRASSIPVGVPQKLAFTLAAGDSWAQLAAGQGFACARTASGHAYCWGSSVHGALGLGAGNANVLTPVQRAVEQQ